MTAERPHSNPYVTEAAQGNPYHAAAVPAPNPYVAEATAANPYHAAAPPSPYAGGMPGVLGNPYAVAAPMPPPAQQGAWEPGPGRDGGPGPAASFGVMPSLDAEDALVPQKSSPVMILGDAGQSQQEYAVKVNEQKRGSFEIVCFRMPGVQKVLRCEKDNVESSRGRVRGVKGDFEVTGKRMTMHGSQVVKEMGGRPLLKVRSESIVNKTTKFQVLDMVKGGCIAAEVSVGNNSNFIRFTNMKGELFASASRPDVPKVTTQDGAELTVKVAAGVDPWFVLLTFMAVQQVGCHRFKNWFSHHVTNRFISQNKYNADYLSSSATYKASGHIRGAVSSKVNNAIDSIADATHIKGDGRYNYY